MPYERQLGVKTETVRSALAGRVDVDVARCLPSPRPEAYRNRAKLAVRRTSDGVLLGLFGRGGHRLVDLRPCRVQRSGLIRALEPLRRWLTRFELAWPEGPVFYVDLREADGGRCHLTLVVSGDAAGDAAGQADEEAKFPVGDLLADWPELIGIGLNVGEPSSSFPMGAVTRTIAGAACFSISVAGSRPGLPFEVPAGGFFQVATDSLGAVHDRMAAHLGESGSLLDLYCGVGLHGIAVTARSTATEQPLIVGVESSPGLVEAAVRNAEATGYRARYHTQPVEAFRPDSPAGDRRDSSRRVVANPGRAGMKPDAIRMLTELRAERVAYLSCNPATLARDLEALAGGGLRTVAVQPIDLMPQTDQVETLALLVGS